MNLHTVSGLIEDEDPGEFLGTAMEEAATVITWTRGLKSQDIFSLAF